MLGPVELVAEIDSTNRELLDRARAGASNGAVLVADHQTAGRGRLGRRWEAEPGAALLVSVLLRPPLAAADAHLVTAVAGLAAVDTCRELGATVALKWPNDVVTPGGKLAGLLAEVVLQGDAVDAVIVGMGMNLRRGSLPEGAVPLEELTTEPVERDDVLARWLRHLERRYDQLLAPGGRRTVAADHRAVCDTLGRRVRVELPSETVEGTAVDMTDAGHLVIRTDGEDREISAGDVVHLRPGPG